MSPHDYCEEKAAPAGSTLYYSTLYLPLRTRRAFCALYAFRLEQLTLSADPSEPGVMLARRAWWLEELQRMEKGTPTHPVTRALQECFDTSVTPALCEMTTGIPEGEGLLSYRTRSGGTVSALLAGREGCAGSATQAPARRLGEACAVAEYHRHAGEADPGAVGQAIREIEETGRALVPPYRYPLLGALTMAAISLAFMKRLRRSGFRTPAADLTPLGKFWIAWRTERLERRSHPR